MTQDVRQWLAEIKLLQQKLTEAQKERDEAYAGAANWRKLYETEAQQRRTEATLARQKVDALQLEIIQARNVQPVNANDPSTAPVIEQEVERLDEAQLKQRLIQTLLKCDRLTQALKHERDNHAKTRKGLTTALGDTVDLLAKERATRGNHDNGNDHAHSTEQATSKTPSLELPSLS